MLQFENYDMGCSEFVEIMKERGFTYNEKSGGFLNAKGKRAGKATRNGFRTISLQKGNKVYNLYENRCVWAWFNGEIPEGMAVRHRDYDRANNRIENLELCTPEEVWKINRKENHLSVECLLRRVRFGDNPSAKDVMSTYPAIVMHTMNRELTEEQRMINAVMGISGEAGEVADIIKKHLYQGHDIDYDHLIEEIGDVLYYITLLLISIDYNMADTMLNNMDKLMKRYPDGFSAERSIHRQE